MLPKVSPTPSNTPSNTATLTPSTTSCPSFITPSATGTNIPTSTPTPSITNTPTNTITPTMTPTPSTPAFDADAAAYLSAVVGAGGTGITSTISAATQTLFIDLKNAGLYSKLYALYPMLGGNYAGCKFNALNPLNTNAAYRLTSGTYSSKGLVGNGSSVFAQTYFNPTTAGVATDSFAMFAYISVSGSTGYDMGGASLNAWNGLGSNYSSSFRGQVEDTGNTQISATGATTGFQAVSRTTSTDLDWIRDGGAVNTFARSSGGGIPNTNILLGVYGGVGFYTNRSIATCGFASGLDATQLGDLRDIINTFESALTR